ncbi:hypothetical protein ERO13_D05G082650v2 [Gossypium hirsutum]|uniref:Uncharacterized protein n=4 Tax=Gossypium TaxID=3633 RepID=A0A5J5RHN8_GOSBA|nr:hypothetical protein ES319_D05G082300v1 [Gossypium barbadense]KAG4145188.1 hypothetical protein ERO13_D05G082650v2 [Gossypium hirsutum]TYG67573.1 hypothetical protein ES288_D05G086800v1 [Gossypium darwinii]TYH69981.1 hypothetical protein ES332_D05G088100v1 [Gossypium tomentosum]TYI80425.1 hypothetical protein E1A91_D05G086600v1 [Gossypium mustelinum]
MVLSGDADITSDFLVPQDVNNADGNFFTFTGMRVLVGEDFPTKFTILKASMAEFPALNGHSVSYDVLQFPAVSTIPPQTHPRPPSSFSLSPEAWNPVSWTQPTSFSRGRGLVHFQYNIDANNPALAVSAFGSANAGTVTSQDSICPLNLHGHNTKYKTRVFNSFNCFVGDEEQCLRQDKGHSEVPTTTSTKSLVIFT